MIHKITFTKSEVLAALIIYLREKKHINIDPKDLASSFVSNDDSSQITVTDFTIIIPKEKKEKEDTPEVGRKIDLS